jgi:ABC-type uncharacterized transport system substrate-binding protein
MVRYRLRWSLTALLTSCISPAMAHPHVWVKARAEMVYESGGKITGIRHAWTFDKGYSAYVVQGLDKNGDGQFSPEELQDLAKENTESLAEFDYFTVLKANGKKQEFGAPRDYHMVYEAEGATLSYFLPLKSPSSTRTMSLEVYDPTFFISFALADGDDAVTLAGAPQGCATNISRPKNVEPSQQQALSESFFETLTAASSFGTQFANKAIVACP